jgi:phage gpG-like protein
MATDNDLTGLINELQNPTPAFRRMGERLLLLTEDRFNEENTPSGQPWPPLAPPTRERKDNDSILTESGQMSGQIGYDVTGDGLLVGGTEPAQKDKMLAHNFGADDTVTVPAHTRTITQAFGKPLDQPTEVQVSSYQMDINIPQRKFLGPSDRYGEILAQILLDHIAAQ